MTRNTKTKFVVRTIGIVVLLALAGELLLRFVWGIGDPLLSVADPDIGYVFAPSQEIQRFGNSVRINSFSQRAEDPLSPKPEDSIRILLIGDSIAFGGTLTDQSDTVSALLDDMLRGITAQNSQTLNASAGSWGIQNALAYVERHGTFEADEAVLLINTGDLCQRKATGDVVGTHPAFPSQKPVSAYEEVVFRYLSPMVSRYIPQQETKQQHTEGTVDVCELYFDENMDSLQQLHSITNLSATPFIVVLNPYRCEIADHSPACEQQERQVFLNFWDSSMAEREGVYLVDMLPIYNRLERTGFDTESLWRDEIHPNQRGNRIIAAAISDRLTSGWQSEASASLPSTLSGHDPR
jgi:hypothetical protein